MTDPVARRRPRGYSQTMLCCSALQASALAGPATLLAVAGASTSAVLVALALAAVSALAVLRPIAVRSVDGDGRIGWRRRSRWEWWSEHQIDRIVYRRSSPLPVAGLRLVMTDGTEVAVPGLVGLSFRRRARHLASTPPRSWHAADLAVVTPAQALLRIQSTLGVRVETG